MDDKTEIPLDNVVGGFLAYRVPTPAAWRVTAPSGRTVRVQVGGTQGYGGLEYRTAWDRAKQIANSLGGGTTIHFDRFHY